MQYVRIARKSVPDEVEKTVEKKVKNMAMKCPICGNYLWGSCEIGHLIPVADGGDLLPVRTFVGVHMSCNRRDGRKIVDLSKFNLKNIILVEFDNT